MKPILKIATVLFLIVVLAACRKDETLSETTPLGLGGDTFAKGPVDKWLYDSITKPYNIEVKYRWDPWEVNLDKTLVPPDESKVIPAMQAIKQIWIDPYNAETGSETFIKRYSPKSFVLVGSPEYNYNGTMLLGQAEGGNKIAMYVINQFDKNNITELRRMLHTIEHEFAHILHQNILYPQEFKSITPAYTSTWFNISDEEAQAQGYVTAYSMAGPDEDFVEMIATMLVEGKDRFNELVAAQDASVQALIRKKEQIVVDYFSKSWNIDFYSLQSRTQQALNRISPPQAVPFYFGFDKIYTNAGFERNNAQLPASTGFTSIYDNVATALNTAYGINVDFIEITMTSATAATLKIYMNDGTNDYLATFTYTASKNASDVYDFNYVSADATGNAIKTEAQPLLDYFNNNTFKLDWYQNPNQTYYPRVVFTPQQTVNATFTTFVY